MRISGLGATRVGSAVRRPAGHWAEHVSVRIGTWNTDGRWSPEHLELLVGAECDVWLLTEVEEQVELDGFCRHLAQGVVGPRRRSRWAGVLSRQPLTALPDPHVASAAAVAGGIAYCSTVLPWANTKGDLDWPGENHEKRTASALGPLLANLPSSDLVWGGDWNHAASGPRPDGTEGARKRVWAAVEDRGLQVATADLPHREDGYLTTDHVAVPSDWVVTGAERLDARGLSDHDCHIVDVDVAGPSTR